MTAPLTVKRNDYRVNRKASNIKTPYRVCDFLADLLEDKIKQNKDKEVIVDIGCGDGRLAQGFYNWERIGIDIKKAKKYQALDIFIKANFLKMQKLNFNVNDVSLVLCNPPFNNKKGRELLPEVFLKKIFELFGEKVPVVLFVPMGFRLNQRVKSKRWQYFRDECSAKITSIISLPLDIFSGVEFHSEILIWNIKGLKPHYWIPKGVYIGKGLTT